VPCLLWDASALIKRYLAEAGSATVNALFTHPAASSSVVTFLGYAETAAIQRRKHNQGALTHAELRDTRLLLTGEILLGARTELIAIEPADVLTGIALIDRHNLNASDAAILAAYLRYAVDLAQTPVLVAADQRLLRAADTEGLRVLNPESRSASEAATFLGAL
jgi:predicted nucleic acid-binding protein